MTTTPELENGEKLIDGEVYVLDVQKSVTQVACQIAGKRSWEVGGVVFTVDEKYELRKAIGVGAYGVVVSGVNTENDEDVAVKKICGVFDDSTDAKRILREIRLMQALQHENILPIVDMEAPECLETFDEIYMVLPLFDKDLGKIIDSDIQLSDDHNRYFIYQILCGLKYLHSASVMHRDLKPANILLKESCDLSLCDFGLARYVEENSEVQKGMTEYVVTRWYRAPELVLTHEYSNAVDLWAVGCIMGDLLGRKVMFPGKDFKHQVEIICEILGKPQPKDYGHVKSARARRFLEKLPDSCGVPLDKLFPGAPPEALCLMQKLLQFDPEKRCTAHEALQHAYLADFVDETADKTAEHCVDLPKLEPKSDDGQPLNTDQLKHLMLMEIFKFRPNAPIFVNNAHLFPK